MTDLHLGANPSRERFVTWCRRRGVFLHPDVGFLVPTRTMGLGVVARRPLPRGTVVVSCPLAAAVSPFAADAPPALRGAGALERDPVLVVALRLLSELGRGAAGSPWRAWLEACPRMAAHLFDLDEAQGALLLRPRAGAGGGPPRPWSGVSQQLLEMDAEGRWARARPWMRAHPDLWPPAVQDDFPLFCECLAQVVSRNFHREESVGREGPYLLPGIDFINHSFEPNCLFSIRGGGRKHAMEFTVVTSRALQAREQVFCSYGRIGAARFVVEFQFITEAVKREDMVRFSAETLVGISTELHCRRQRSSGPALATEEFPNGLIDANGGGKDGPDQAGIAKTEDTVAGEEEERWERDMRYRVDRLQRSGVLYDEGLYLLQPDYYPSQAALNVANQSGIREAEAKRQAEVFETTYRGVPRDWEPPITPPLKAWAQEMLEAKKRVASFQNAHVDDVFRENTPEEASPSSSTNTVSVDRRFLLHEVLQSECTILERYQLMTQNLPCSLA